MLKKFLCFSIIFLISLFIFNSCFATDIVMDLENTTDNTNSSKNIDNTVYSETQSTNNSVSSDSEEVATTITTDYEDSSELSVSNIINIILISVGVVLILLGIAIIIKLK